MFARSQLLLPLSVVVACGSDEPLELWAGTWQAAEPMFRDPAADAAYQAIHDLRPEYSVDEIRQLFISTADVDYTALRVEGGTLTFLDGATTLCAAEYSTAVANPGVGGGPETYTDFHLEGQPSGDCTSYQTVSLTSLLVEDSQTHVHIVTSTSAGRLHPPPWNPSVWSPTTTAAWFAGALQAQAGAIAASLPAR
jgi:hypothetical protein